MDCFGASTGEIYITASNGTPGYSYLWSNSNTSPNIIGVVAGTYTVTVTDINGCTATLSATITEPTNLLSSITASSDVSCFAGNDGSATVIAAGGAGGYTYNWSPSGGTAATAGALVAGNYTVQVTDANGCTKTSTVLILEPTALTASISGSDVSCNGGANGNSTVVIGNGTPGYTYSWTPSGGTAATANALMAGTYTVTATDANGCTITSDISISEPLPMMLTVNKTDVSCNSGLDGSLHANPTGGSAPYTYFWSPNGATTQTNSGLNANTYTVTVTDSQGCTISAVQIVSEPSALTATHTQIDVLCNGGNNASATISAAGGTAPYAFNWSPSGGTDSIAIGLTAGSYNVTITDNNGCSIIENVVITQPSPVNAIIVSSSNISCFSGTDGNITVSAAGGTPGYTYNWIPTGQSTPTATSLSAGSHVIEVTDANGCIAKDSIILTQPTALAVTMASTDANCNAAADGTTDRSCYRWCFTLCLCVVWWRRKFK